jgi:hypothetical protein
LRCRAAFQTATERHETAAAQRLLPDCAPLLDGALIPVKHLIDGAAIVTVACAEVGCCHVERPLGMLAERLAAESYPEGILGISPCGGGVVAPYLDLAALPCGAPLAVTGRG